MLSKVTRRSGAGRGPELARCPWPRPLTLGFEAPRPPAFGCATLLPAPFAGLPLLHQQTAAVIADSSGQHRLCVCVPFCTGNRSCARSKGQIAGRHERAWVRTSSWLRQRWRGLRQLSRAASAETQRHAVNGHLNWHLRHLRHLRRSHEDSRRFILPSAACMHRDGIAPAHSSAT